MKHLIIIGARGWGREVYGIALACIKAGADIQVKGYLDDKKDALDGYLDYPPIISSVENYQVQPDDVFVCALGSVKWKEHYINLILQKGGQFISLVHPTAIIGHNSKIGVGCIISNYAAISCDVTIGNYVTMSAKSGIGHDGKVGDFCHISALDNISGFVTIGNRVTIHPCADITPHRQIGDNATIGTGSVVINNVKANTTVFGNPAKKMEL